MNMALKVELSSNPEEALRQLCGVAQDLVALLREEGKALDSSDFSTFKTLQPRKAAVALAHEETALAFQDRALSFRGVDARLLDRLEALQHEIGSIGKENLAKIKALQENNASANPLLWAQEQECDD